MNVKYRLHPQEYAIGECENLYSDMAVRGWLLEKRGSYFSRFRRGEPEAHIYRIEFSSPAFLEDSGLPEEQTALYEDCGWKYITGSGFVHVFTAPEGSGAPEIHTDPRGQAGTLKALRRSYLTCWIVIFLALGFNLLMACAFSGSVGEALSRWGSDLALGFFRSTSLFLFYLFFLILAVFTLIYSAVQTRILYKRLKSGIPLDHSPSRKRRASRAVCAVLSALCLVFLLLTIVQLITVRKYDMPEVSDGPYITLWDMGISGKRTENLFDNSVSSVEVTDSLICTYYDTREFVDGKWMYQDVYVLRSAGLADTLVRHIMNDCTFAEGPEDFSAVEIDGLDGAWQCGMEFICVRGGTVWYITCASFGNEELFPLNAVAASL